LHYRNFLEIGDLSPPELRLVLDKAAAVKKNPQAFAHSLSGKMLAYYSQKPSTRTKLSLQAAVSQLGGSFADMAGSHLSGGHENVTHTAKVVSKYADFVAARVFSQSFLEEFAAHSAVPVINALSDIEHPCQALADLETVLETAGPSAKIAFVGDGNNVCASLAIGACMLGLEMRVASPRGYGLPETIVNQCKSYGGKLELFESPSDAVSGADVVYTDVWVSMGDEAESEKRAEAFKGFTVTQELMELAVPGAVFMHCLPCIEGAEVASEVINGPSSVVFQQAENRLHSQKALLLFIAGGEKPWTGSGAMPARLATC
jgi:ornithine carbamoyltransferase